VEILLNLAWAALALLMVCTWLRVEDGTDRRRQIIAICVLIAILFPVISVSDDLMAVQTATETDTCQRRDHLVTPGAYPNAPHSVALPASLFQGVTVATLGFAPLPILSAPTPDYPGIPAIQNRPPPAA
jgi:hypothetical protein